MQICCSLAFNITPKIYVAACLLLRLQWKLRSPENFFTGNRSQILLKIRKIAKARHFSGKSQPQACVSSLGDRQFMSRTFLLNFGSSFKKFSLGISFCVNEAIMLKKKLAKPKVCKKLLLLVFILVLQAAHKMINVRLSAKTTIISLVFQFDNVEGKSKLVHIVLPTSRIMGSKMLGFNISFILLVPSLWSHWVENAWKSFPFWLLFQRSRKKLFSNIACSFLLRSAAAQFLDNDNTEEGRKGSNLCSTDSAMHKVFWACVHCLLPSKVVIEEIYFDVWSKQPRMARLGAAGKQTTSKETFWCFDTEAKLRFATIAAMEN